MIVSHTTITPAASSVLTFPEPAGPIPEGSTVAPGFGKCVIRFKDATDLGAAFAAFKGKVEVDKSGKEQKRYWRGRLFRVV
jgi:hypothetical protein